MTNAHYPDAEQAERRLRLKMAFPIAMGAACGMTIFVAGCMIPDVVTHFASAAHAHCRLCDDALLGVKALTAMISGVTGAAAGLTTTYLLRPKNG